MTPSEIEVMKQKTQRDIAREHEDREDKRARKGNITKLIGSAIPKAAGIVGKVLNDPDWYKQYDGLDGVNTTIPDFTVGDSEDLTIRSTEDANASVYVVRYIPTIGQTGGIAMSSSSIVWRGVSEANTAIARIRAQLGKRNSIALNLSKDTFGRYMVAAIDAIEVPMKRIKTAIDVYTVANAFYPKLAAKLIEGLGFNYVEFDTFIPWIRDKYNKLANKINASIPMVKSCTLVSRRNFLCGHIIRDRDDARAQYVLFAPLCDAFVSSSTDLIKYAPIRSMSIRTYFDMIDKSFNHLVDGATWRQVIRLFYNGFDEKEFYQIPTSPDVITTGMMYSEEMLNQLHNLRTAPYIQGPMYGYDGTGFYVGELVGDSLTIGGNTSDDMVQGLSVSGATIPSSMSNLLPSQGPVFVRYATASTITPTMENAFKFGNDEPDLATVWNSFKKPNADDYLVGTRLTAEWRSVSRVLANGVPSSDNLNIDGLSGYLTGTNVTFMAVFPTVFGTELPYDIKQVQSSEISTTYQAVMYSFNENVPHWNDFGMNIGLHTREFFPVSATYSQSMSKLSKYSVLDWLPLYRVTFGGVSSSNRNNYVTFGELSHYTVIPTAALEKLHGQAILSEFSIASDKFLPPLK